MGGTMGGTFGVGAAVLVGVSWHLGEVIARHTPAAGVSAYLVNVPALGRVVWYAEHEVRAAV